MSLTPDLPDIIDAGIATAIDGLNFCTVGVVQSYDGKRKATIVPQIKKLLPNGDTIDLDPITDVAVSFPGTPISGIAFDLPTGTTGTIIFSDRSLDEWLSSGGTQTVSPKIQRQHAMTDAIFYPGVVPFAMARATEIGMLEVYNGLGRVKIDTAGRIQIGTELVDLIKIFSDTLLALSTTVAGGFPLSSAAMLAKLQAQLLTIQGAK